MSPPVRRLKGGVEVIRGGIEVIHSHCAAFFDRVGIIYLVALQIEQCNPSPHLFLSLLSSPYLSNTLTF